MNIIRDLQRMDDAKFIHTVELIHEVKAAITAVAITKALAVAAVLIVKILA